jgi:hypothetical protein
VSKDPLQRLRTMDCDLDYFACRILSDDLGNISVTLCGTPAHIVGWKAFECPGSCPVRILSVDPGQRDGCKVLLRWLRNAGHLWPALGVVYLHQFRRDKPRLKQLRFRPTDLYDHPVVNEGFQHRIAGVVASVQANGLVDPGSEFEIACMEMFREEPFVDASPGL